MTEVVAPSSANALKVIPQTAACGAVIEGVSLREAWSPAQLEQLKNLLARYGVLFFRGQHLSDDEHLRVAEQFGRPSVHPVAAYFSEGAVIQQLEDNEHSAPKNNEWHTDATYLPEPPHYAVLRALESPECGGDTMWAHMGVAYTWLSDHTRRLLEGLTAHHDPKMRANLVPRGFDPIRTLELEQAFPGVSHPVVRTHPVTGQQVLYVNRAFTTHIEGLSQHESQALLTLLFEHLADPRFSCRYRWQEGDVAIWDEFATQHYAVDDHFPARRVMRRITVGGTSA
ncbi:TauD/TfdA dioxygenase family protein [Rhodococcus sp. NPDC003322]